MGHRLGLERMFGDTQNEIQDHCRHWQQARHVGVSVVFRPAALRDSGAHTRGGGPNAVYVLVGCACTAENSWKPERALLSILGCTPRCTLPLVSFRSHNGTPLPTKSTHTHTHLSFRSALSPLPWKIFLLPFVLLSTTGSIGGVSPRRASSLASIQMCRRSTPAALSLCSASKKKRREERE